LLGNICGKEPGYARERIWTRQNLFPFSEKKPNSRAYRNLLFNLKMGDGIKKEGFGG